MIALKYEQGRIKIQGGQIYLDGLDASDTFPAYMYRDIINHLNRQKVKFKDNALEKKNPPKLSSNIKLRGYQEKALKEWSTNGGRGIVVLPTGAGKTFLAVKAIERLKTSTLVVVPTIVLLEQWKEVLEKAFKITVGALGGGKDEITEITVATYDSASIKSKTLGNQFELIVFDEVHHMPAPSYRNIAIRYLAPYRLGLTATLQVDEPHEMLFEKLLGPTVYRLEVDDLAGEHLADFTVRTVKVPLTQMEAQEYDRLYGIYRSYLQKHNIRIRGNRDYLRFVMRSGRDPKARRALISRNRAMDLALNSSNKVAYLKSLIKANPDEKTLIFTSRNKLVYKLSKELLIPAITHQTPSKEREHILRNFMKGAYNRIVTSRVLDEGVDVPDASMAVIISGTGSKRQFIQRLGRILRKQPGKQAILYELVSAGTAETYMSRRRKR